MIFLGRYGIAETVYFPLYAAGTMYFQANPTLAAGDALVSTDGGAMANADNLPTVAPAASAQVKWTASIAEMTGKVCTLIMSDVAGAEWEDQMITVYTYGHASAHIPLDLSALLKTGVGAMDTDVLDAAALKADAVTEIQSGLARTGADSDTLETLSDQLDGVHREPTGARAITLHFQEADTTPIPDAMCYIRNAADDTTLWTVGPSDSGGDIAVSVNDATYNLRPVKIRVEWSTVPQPMVVTADATVNVEGAVQVPSAASAPNLCVIYGTVRDDGGVVLIGAEVDAYAITPQVVSGVQMAKRIASATTDAVGYFELELEKTAEVRFSIEDAGRDETLTVPNLAKQDIATWT